MNEFQLLTCSNLQPSDIVETICVSSSSWHCNTLYTCFFDWNCEHDKQKECHMKSKAGTEIINKNCSTKFMKRLCSILSISLLQRKRNDETREQCCNQPTIKHDQQQRPHWFEHAYRMEENCLPKKKKTLMEDWPAKWKCSRNPPKKRCWDQIVPDVGAFHLIAWCDIIAATQNRKKWIAIRPDVSWEATTGSETLPYHR